jgi:uncharacterized membrane protein (DUF2068 family)
VRTGDPSRSRLLLRLIAAERVLRGTLLVGAGLYLFSHLGSDFGRVAERIMRAVELDPRTHFLHRIVDYLHNLRTHELKIAAALAIGYGVLELVEGVGLWLDQIWAEYLVIVATSLLIPFELYELVRHPSPWKAAGILVNVLIVLYLVHLLRRRRRSRPV